LSQEVTVSAGRFPWVPAFEERYGVDKASWRALIDAVFPTATSLDSVVLALSYCKARRLDPFKRPVHIVPMYDKNRGGTVDTIWPGIGELRTTAVRTGAFGGRDAAVFGPTITKKFGTEEIEHPEWCEVVIYRMVAGHRAACHGPRVYWRETYAPKRHDDPTPNSMWKKRPFGQIEKCAEAGALRAAFPEEIGNEYTADEMEGKVIEGRFEHVQSAPIATTQPTQNKLAAFGQNNGAGKPAETASSTAAPEGSSSAPAPFDAEVAPSRVKAIVEAFGLVRDRKSYNGHVKTNAFFLGQLDEHWPEGKDQIITAMKAAEDQLAGGPRADVQERSHAPTSARTSEVAK